MRNAHLNTLKCLMCRLLTLLFKEVFAGGVDSVGPVTSQWKKEFWELSRKLATDVSLAWEFAPKYLGKSSEAEDSDPLGWAIAHCL